MKKIFNIAFKDLLLNFRDPMGLVIMLAAPLALTMVIAAAFGGGNSGSSAGLSNIPVILVNHDAGMLSPYFIEAFSSDELADLVEPSILQDETAARKLLDDDEAAAVVIIPANFSESILPASLVSGESSPPAFQNSTVEVYANPSRSISAGIIRSIVDEVLNRFISGRISSEVTIGQLITSGRISPQEAAAYGASIGPSLANVSPAQQVKLNVSVNGESTAKEFSWLEYMAPSMAILFLMFTLSNAGRSLLGERDNGTLPRMMVSPSTRAEILGGKMLGNYLTGLLQMAILFVAGHYLFQISWGTPLAVILLTLALVAAITGWGMLPAVFSRTPGQASAIGTAITLTFSALSGTFVPRGALPVWLQNLGLVTPNAWGNEWYYKLINGASLADIVPAVLVLSGMAVILFAVSAWAFRRQYR